MVLLMMEAGLAHRTIGQRGFDFAGRERPRSPLDEIAAFQRRYRLRKRELMEWWSRKLLTIVEGPKEGVVVRMPNVRRG